MRRRRASRRRVRTPHGRTVVFFVAPRRQLPLPSGMAFVFDPARAEVGVIAGAPAAAKVEPPSGGSVVRVWQLRTDGRVLEDPMGHLDRVLRRVAGTRVVGRHGGGDDKPPPDDQDATVLELVVRLRPGPAPVQQAFRSAWAGVELLARAHAIASGTRATPLQVGDVFPLALFLTRERGRWDRGSLSTYLLDTMDHVVARELQGPAEIEVFKAMAKRLRAGDAWALYAERRAAARREWANGDFTAAVIDSAVAVEILMDAALAWALWEDGATPADAGPILSRPLADRVKTQMHPRFGGSWDVTATPALRAWHQDLAGLRNRIVHRGRRPTEKQASDAITAADGMAALLTDRLLGRLASYPALALAVIGAYELKRLGVYTLKVDAAFQDAGRESGGSLERHVAWREQADQYA